ncbi:MAG: SWIM zinc finger family protein [Chloroflexota bacterium]
MSTIWNTAQIVALAPDSSSAKAGKSLATPRKWVVLGVDEQAVWGECQGSAKEPYRTQVDANETAFRCSCPSRKLPCKHGLGLLFLLESQPAAFTAKEQPTWVTEWLASRAKRAQQKANREERGPENRTVVDLAAQAKRLAGREAKVTAGLADLELWLHDLIRNGLATAQGKPTSYWETTAARMVDAQAPGVARLLREMAGIGNSGAGWEARLLERLGRLHLLLEGFKFRADLSPATQADIRSLIGWTQDQEQLLAWEGVRDNWLVVGQRVVEEDRMRVQRTWLWGQQSQRAALVLSFAPSHQPLDTSLIVGTGLEAELVFYPSGYPLRALVKQRYSPPVNFETLRAGRFTGGLGYPAIAVAYENYAKALASYPWLEEFPMALTAAIPVQLEQNWVIRDLAGQWLPLSPRFTHIWHLVALSGGKPLPLFGEWDGNYFLPLSVWSEGRFIIMKVGL